MKEQILKLFSFLFVFSIPFGAKKFIFQILDSSPINEQNSFFIYGYDIIILLFFLFLFFNFREFFKVGNLYENEKKVILFLFIFCAFCLFSVFFSFYKDISLYSFLRLFLFLFSGYIWFILFRSGKISLITVAYGFVLSSLFQSVIAFFQFFFQKSIGLRLLGETVIEGVSQSGIAGVLISGTRLLRSYGTMPHSNILACFLILGIISAFYLWMKNEKGFLNRIILSLCIFSIFFGLVLTFSRSGWIVVFSGVFVFFALLFSIQNKTKETAALFVVFVASIVILLISMGWAIFPRATLSRTDPSIDYRFKYNKIGFEIIESHPLGVGIGNESLVSSLENRFIKEGIYEKPNWQPVHNLFLLITTEVGVQGIISFLFFLLFLFLNKKNFFLKKFPEDFLLKNGKLEVLTLFTIIFSLLVFGLFDHFLWTIESGGIMMWSVIGMFFGLNIRDNL